MPYDRGCLLQGDSPRTWWIEDQSDGIRTVPYCRMSVFQSRDAADFDACSHKLSKDTA